MTPISADPLKRCLPAEYIESGRLILKRHELSFASTMFQGVERDRERLKEFLPWVEQTETLQDAEGYVRTAIDRWDQHELFDYSIFLKEGGVHLGNICAHSLSWDHRRCEVGYWILGEYEGKGFVSEALRALESNLFQLGLNRIEIHCSSANPRSGAVPRRCSYVLDATLRQSLIEQERFCDTLVYSKLYSEWVRLRSG